MLKADRRPWTGALGGVAFLAVLLTIGDWIFKGAPLWQAIIGGAGFFLIFGGLSRFREFKRLQRAEQRRQAAATGLWSLPLVSPQPIPDPAALPLPSVIRDRSGWLPSLFVLVWVWVGVMLWLLWLWPYDGPFLHLLLLSIMFTVPLSIVTPLFSYRWIEVSDESLTIRSLFWSRSLRWREACLFAIDAAVKTTDEPRKYELSSATIILRWSRGPKPSRPTRPFDPFQEDARQMDSLLSLIAGRTGLPLYDLRDWEWQALQAPQYPLSPQS